MKSKYLRIGQIVRAHGVRGDVKLLSLTDDPARFLSLKEAYLERDGVYALTPVSQVRLLGSGCALHLAGCDTAEAAEKLKGAFLCVDRTGTVQLPANAYFVADLIGCETFDTAGKAYGKITDVLNLPANDVYEIDGGRLLVPALKRVLHQVDVDTGRIVFDADALGEVGLFRED